MGPKKSNLRKANQQSNKTHRSPKAKAKLPEHVESISLDNGEFDSASNPVKLTWDTALLAAKADKQLALKSFWESNHLPDKAPQILRGDSNIETPADSTFGLFWHPIKKLLEARRQGEDQGYIPESHRGLYNRLAEQIAKPHLMRIQKSMVALHLRSGEGVFFLILQVKPESANTWREITRLSEWIQREMPEIKGCYVATGAENPFRWGNTMGIQLKKEFGPDTLHSQFGEKRHFFQPLDQQELDRSALPLISDIIQQLLKPNKEQNILLLESRCPAYTIDLASLSKGVSISDSHSICRESFARNRERHEWKNVRFHRFDSDKDWQRLNLYQGIVCSVPLALNAEQIKMLIETTADRVVRRFRSPEELGKEWGKWRKQGWVLYRAKFLDQVPAHKERLDVFALFQKDHRGILNIAKDERRERYRRDASDYDQSQHKSPEGFAKSKSPKANFPRFSQK